VNARETAGPVTSLYDEALASPHFIQVNADMVHAHSERVLKTLILTVCAWSLIEAPLELDMSDPVTGVLALLVSKLVVVGTGLAAFAKVRFAYGMFAFICGASLLAVAPALPTEFKQSFAIALFSTIECFSKAACVMAIGLASLRSKRARQQ
jgi:hypothetical protein